MMEILLVEDDEVDVMTVQRLLKKNHVVNPLYIAENGLEALAMLREPSSQSLAAFTEHLLILLDLNMPKMNGREFLTHLRSDSNLKKLPVIVFITSEEEKHRLEKSHLNIVGYLSKPITFSELTQLMKTLNKHWVFQPIPQAL
jgi:CheY-like chemotaxis protein